jgi:hypothetical protein
VQISGKEARGRQLGRPRRRWVDNIGMDAGQIGWGAVDWSGSVQGQVKSINPVGLEFVVETLYVFSQVRCEFIAETDCRVEV